jgi:hypothetical protein
MGTVVYRQLDEIETVSIAIRLSYTNRVIVQSQSMLM